MPNPDGWPNEDDTVPNTRIESPPVVIERRADPDTTVVGPPMGPPVPPPYAEGPDDRFGMGLLIGILVLVAIGAVVAAVLLTRHHDHGAVTTTTIVEQSTPVTTAPARPGAVPVPNLIGESATDAAKSLGAMGLSSRVETVPGAPPAGRVIGESPAPSRKATSGSIVTLEISNGAVRPSATTTVPARPRTTSTPSATTTAPPTTQPSTTTQAVTTAPPATTTSTTTSAPTAASVPDVSGETVQAAAQTLSRAGLLVSIAYVPSPDPLGTVEAESPAAGTTAPTGSHVTINAASGPGQKVQETVPDASGQMIPQAVAKMQKAGLRLIFVRKPVTQRALAGHVVEQTPAAGSTAPKNAQVLVYMGAFGRNGA